MVIRLNLQSFVAGLIDSLNQFTYQLFKLEVWQRVFEKTDEQTKIDILWGTVSPLAQSLVGMPWNYRKKLLYCSIVLLNDAKEMTSGPMGAINEASFGYKTLQNHAMFEELTLDKSSLLSSISAINTGKIAEYRNELNHRIPPNIEFGHSVLAVRSPTGRSYGMSGRPPFTLDKALPLLISEQARMKDAFIAFWDFAQSLMQELRVRENA